MTVLDNPSAASPAPGRATYREDLVTVVVGTWLVLALFSDGWAHFNVPDLEGFFTPWHGMLYSGFTAAAAWIGVMAVRRQGSVVAALRAPLTAARQLPAGYPPAAAGVVVFAVGGVLDLMWHTAFGVEAGVDALVSPSHLTLFTGGLLLLSAPVRGAWHRPDLLTGDVRARFPELLSLALTTGLVAFFLLYVSAFVRPGVDQGFRRLPEGAAGHEQAELPAIATLGAYLLTTAVVVIPLLLLARRATLPRGAVTFVVGTVVWLSVAVDDFSRVEVAVAVTAAAVVADLLLARLEKARGRSTRGRLPLIGALVPALVWTAQLVAVAVSDGIRYPVALWTGVVFLAVLLGVLLGIVASPVAGERLAAASVPDRHPPVELPSAP